MRNNHILNYILLLFGFIGLGRTLNNSVRLIEHIFTPINMGTGTLFYGQLFNVIVIFIGIKGILKLNNIKKNLGLKSFVMMILTIAVFLNIWNYGIKLYMSTQDNLMSIYNYHEGTSINLNLSDEVIIISLNLENCSNTSQVFNLLVYIPDEWRKYGLSIDSVDLSKSYNIHSNEKMTIVEEIKVDINSATDQFSEFIHSDEVTFRLYTETKESRLIQHIY